MESSTLQNKVEKNIVINDTILMMFFILNEKRAKICYNIKMV